MFRGEFLHTIDEKGRVIIPTRFREELGEVFFATRGAENCIYLYSSSRWEKIEAQLCELPTSKYGERAFVRSVMSSVCDCEMNKQGRVLMPGNLRKHAGLVKDVALIGALTHVEIWDAERWKTYNRQVADNGRFEEVAAGINIGL